MTMIDFEDSLRKIREIDVEPLVSEKVSLVEARGRILATDIYANESLPSSPTSAMDGYAIAYKKGVDAYELIGDVPAGTEATKLKEGQTLKTFTGSLIAKGADTIVPIEDVEVTGNKVLLRKTVELGQHIREPGEVYKEGELLIAKGTKIDYAQIALLASLNRPDIEVERKINLAVFSSGSELLEVGTKKSSEAQIYSSNNYMLEGMFSSPSINIKQYGIVKDSKESLKETIASASSCSDIVVSTGGVSVGDYDFTKEVVEALGYEIIFKGVKIKPGQHILIARKGSSFFVGLPGFAYSSLVTALIYVKGLIAILQGEKFILNFRNALLGESYTKKSQRAEFVPVVAKNIDGEIRLGFEGMRGGTSAVITNVSIANALMYVPQYEGSKEAGEVVKILEL